MSLSNEDLRLSCCRFWKSWGWEPFPDVISLLGNGANVQWQSYQGRVMDRLTLLTPLEPWFLAWGLPLKPFELCIIWVQGIRSHGPPGKGGVDASELKKVDYRDCLTLFKAQEKESGKGNAKANNLQVHQRWCPVWGEAGLLGKGLEMSVYRGSYRMGAGWWYSCKTENCPKHYQKEMAPSDTACLQGKALRGTRFS